VVGQAAAAEAATLEVIAGNRWPGAVALLAGTAAAVAAADIAVVAADNLVRMVSRFGNDCVGGGEAGRSRAG
jgi:hypothetical protein